MKLQIKQFIILFLLLILLTLFSGLVIPAIGRLLYIFRISNIFYSHKEFPILLIIFIHFLIGYLLINKIMLLKNLKNRYIFLFFLTMNIIIPIVVKLVLENDNPTFFLKEISGVIALGIGLFFRNSKKKYSLVLSLVSIVIFLVFTKNIILPLSGQYSNYGSFIGKPKNLIEVNNLKLIDSNGNKADINTTNNQKIIVIDFWNNYCSVCFKKFPIIKNLQEKYKDSNVLVIAINVYANKEEIIKSKKLLKQTNNSNLITYYMSKEDSKKFNLKWYPNTFVIKNNQIVFEGQVEILKLFEQLYLE